MQSFELSVEEREVLHDVLESEFKKIDLEVLHTDSHEFRELLKHRRTILEGLLGKLAAAPAAAQT